MKQKNTKFLFIIFVLIIIVIYILTSDILKLKSYNILYKMSLTKNTASNNIVLVVIDDKSLHEIGRWPWNREYYLEIFDYFENYTNAKLVGYDALIMAPDSEHPDSDKKFFSQIGKFKKLTVGYAFSNNEFDKNVSKEEYNNILNKKNIIKVIDKRSEKNKKPSGLKSFTTLQKTYFKNVSNIGFANMPEDIDGYVRKSSQIIDYNNNFYPSLGLSLYSQYSGIKEYILTDTYIYGLSQNDTLKIPVENNGGLILNYISYYKNNNGTYSHIKYSASDIINSYRAIKNNKKPIIDSSIFDNKVVFVGANANAQALNDVARTPISENFAGLDIQATNFNNLIKNDFYKMTSNAYNFAFCILIFLLVFYFVVSMPIISALLSSILVALAYLFFSLFMFYHQIALDLILPELFAIIALGCAYSYKYLIEGYKKEKIQKAMGKYLSYDVMEKVVKNIDNVELGGKREDITVLFADIRNFTSISENMDANSVSSMLNEYFSAMVPIIEQNNGVLNKFMGDAILAIFGEPKRSENHALDAIFCADQMLKKVKYFQEKWIDEGKPKIEIGIGISSGEAFIGNIGSKDRLEYTVIGDTVNTASRIENYNKVYKTNFLISESTYQRTKKHLDVITISNVVIRGKINKVNLYEVVRVNNRK